VNARSGAFDIDMPSRARGRCLLLGLCQMAIDAALAYAAEAAIALMLCGRLLPGMRPPGAITSWVS
jgi:hypothetical protein